MTLEPVVITEATISPVQAAELRAHLNLTTTSLDSYLTSLITASTQYFEAHTGRTLHQTVYEHYLDYFPTTAFIIELPRASPLLSVDAVGYTDHNDAETLMAASAYKADTKGQIGNIRPAYGMTWPAYVPCPVNSVRIRYTAGIVDGGSPQVYPAKGIRQAIMMLAGALFENRETEVIPDRSAVQNVVLQYGLDAFLNIYKVKYAF